MSPQSHHSSKFLEDRQCRRRTARARKIAVAPTLRGGSLRGLAPAPSWVDKPMRWAQLTLVEDDPGKFDPAVLARLLPAHTLRRRLPQRGRLRGVLPDEGPLPSSQRVARRAGRVRRTGRRLPEARHGRHRPHRSARDLRRRAGGASRIGSRWTPTANRAGTGRRRRCG